MKICACCKKECQDEFFFCPACGGKEFEQEGEQTNVQGENAPHTSEPNESAQSENTFVFPQIKTVNPFAVLGVIAAATLLLIIVSYFAF